MRAFWVLHTERGWGWNPGPIPESKIRVYGEERLGLESTIIELFVALIRAMDAAFLKDVSDQQRKERERNKQPKGSRFKRG